MTVEKGTSPAKAYDAFLDEQKLKYGFGGDDLDGWRPTSGRGRKRGPRPASGADSDADDATSDTGGEPGERDEPEDETLGEDEATS